MFRPIPILCYHEFDETFIEHFEYLKSRGFTTAHLRDVKNYLLHPDKNSFPQNVVVLTFDDAYQDFFDKTRPLLQQYNFTATVGVPTGYISDSADYRRRAAWQFGPVSPTMIWDEIRQLVTEGFEIASHSVNHIPFTNETFGLCPELLPCETQCSKRILEAKLGQETVEFFVFPGGDGWGRSNIEELLRQEGYIGALRTEPRDNDDPPGWDEFRILRWQVGNDTTIEKVLEQIDAFGND